ncbi:carbonic anhydrase [Candidatus Chrysopegis kryptomonas]|jgi:hypothetical protein|uniref:Carbonic anhydrase n=1 Tax=Candidatus Chryseopegocella kryptomonas TaxID=1633643 RepID=A0A0P1NZM4_9BACT|nr:carbonic anhydrase [Candidatus Chrysopegis kryptomonas]CUT05220.1 hypothetical protein JGI23_01914 [Candidatus Chrysopegis kryptomonas]
MPKFATAINCIDGRTQVPVIEFLKQNYNVDFVDLITFPGVDGVLTSNRNDVIELIKRNVEISIKAHASNLVVISGHYDCAGNPVDENTHIKQILNAVEKIKQWGFDVEVKGLWIDENWKVKELKAGQ